MLILVWFKTQKLSSCATSQPEADTNVFSSGCVPAAGAHAEAITSWMDKSAFGNPSALAVEQQIYLL